MIKKSVSVYLTLGASNHALSNRVANDYYATDPEAVRELLRIESFTNVWEPACGGGSISETLKQNGISIFSTDLYDNGYGDQLGLDFLSCSMPWTGDIVTNPPYNFVQEFVEKCMELTKDGSKTAMFLRLLFLEGKKRKLMFEKYPPKTVYVASGRYACYPNGDFSKKLGSAIAYAWFVWEKGFTGDPVIKWIH